MASAPNSKPKAKRDDGSSPERLTPVERLIERADINAAECIVAFSKLILALCLGIGIIITAASGRQFELPAASAQVIGAVAAIFGIKSALKPKAIKQSKDTPS